MPVKNTLPSADETPRAARRKRSVKVVTPDHPLVALIPDEERLEGYASRYVGGILDLAVMAAAFRQRHNVAIYGPTGSAKTSLVLAFARKKMLPVVTVPCNGAADPDFFFGGWRPRPDGTFRLVPADLYYIARYGGLIYLDEFNFLPPKMAALFHGPMDSRRIMRIPAFDGCEDQLDAMGNPILGTFVLHHDCMFVAAWNPDYAGTYQVNDATFNRFCHKLEFDYDPTVEAELVSSESLIEMAEKIRAGARQGTLTTGVTTNALLELEANAEDEELGITYAFENFLQAWRADERKSIKEILDQFRDRIIGEWGLDSPEAGVAEDGTDSVDWDNYYDEEEVDE